jgi:hypothetical protein
MMQGNFQASDYEKVMDFVAEKRNTQQNSNKLNFPFQQRGYTAVSLGQNNHSGEIKH